jgi:hypothetical protein
MPRAASRARLKGRLERVARPAERGRKIADRILAYREPSEVVDHGWSARIERAERMMHAARKLG